MTVIPRVLVDDLVKAALREDLGIGGDLSSIATIGHGEIGRFVIKSRAEGILSGIHLAESAFRNVNPLVHVHSRIQDGMEIQKGDVIADIKGPIVDVLTAERVALNFLGRMCGIATLTHTMQSKVIGLTKIAATRKTTPGLRAIEKHAVRCGGGMTHRFRLDDCIMIKDNHIAANGGDIKTTLERARAYAGHTVKIEIEVDTVEQFNHVYEIGIADIVLLDNMSCADMHKIVKKNKGKFILEASGNVTMETISEISKTGVDVISIGALTHSARNFDVGLDAL